MTNNSNTIYQNKLDAEELFRASIDESLKTGGYCKKSIQEIYLYCENLAKENNELALQVVKLETDLKNLKEKLRAI